MVRKHLEMGEPEYFGLQARVAQLGTDGLNSLLSFHTSRLRVIRASMVNFPMTAFVVAYANRQHAVLCTALVIVGVALMVLCTYGYANLCHRYYRALPHYAKLAVESPNESGKSKNSGHK